jgi:hypothetical protein
VEERLSAPTAREEERPEGTGRRWFGFYLGSWC